MELSKKAVKFIIAVAGVSLLAKLIKGVSAVIPTLAPLFSAMTRKEAASIGIIGGADGPTAIYLTDKFIPPLNWLFILCSLAEVVLLVFLFVKAIKALRKRG